jgi:AraC-like DNA-binding protein
VRRRIIEALPSGPPALSAVARALGQSPRSLRRHLASEGTSFQRLVEQIRSELAAQHLQDPRLTVSEIAFLVGFSELSPFLRAFRRWTGLTPGEYRHRGKAPARSASLQSRPARAR